MATCQNISPSVFSQNSVFSAKTSLASSSTFGELSPSLLFSPAADLYIKLRSVNATRARYVAQNTIKAYRRHTGALALFLEGTPLNKITLKHLRDYQAARVQGAPPFIRRRRPHEEPGPCPCLPQQVNQELCFLRAVMRRAGCNMEGLQHYEELQEQGTEVARALSPEEHALWLDVSRQKERWSLVHWYSILAFDTTASTNELRGLRIGDIDIQHRLISIPWPASKNRFRHRSIVLDSADALWACERLIERASKMGSHAPQHYLFPYHETRRKLCTPDRPMSESGLKGPWQEVRDATGLTWFRPYDTRHTAITRMAESGIPIAVIMAKAGHINPKMTEHYTHIGVAAQRHWVRFSQEARYPEQHHTHRSAGEQDHPTPTRTRKGENREACKKIRLFSSTFTYAGHYFA